MPDEREVKLAAPPAFAMPDVTSAGQGLRVRAEAPLRTTTTYHDTADLRLARAGASLRFRTGQGWTLKLPGGERGGILRRPELVFDGPPEDVPTAAANLVRGIIRTAPLERVVRLRTVRRRSLVDAEDGTELLEVDDDEVSILGPGNRIAGRFRELEVELREATPDDVVDAVVGLLRAAGAGEPDPTSKYLRALGSRGSQPPDLVLERIGKKATAAEVIRAALAGSVLHLLAADPMVRLDEDVEGVHQMRVASRRLRSHLRTFRAFTEPAWNASLREELGWLGRILGANRDADVLLERLRDLTARAHEHTNADRLIQALEAERDAAHAVVLEALGSDRYPPLLDRLVEAARSPALTPDAEGPAAALLTPVQAQWASLRGRVRSAARPPTDEQLHRVRIHAKRTRYAAESLLPVARKDARRFAAAAADLQDVLGEQHDAIVMRGWLRAQATERSADRATAFVAGELAGLEQVRAEAARERWRGRYRRLRASKEPDRWLKRAKESKPAVEEAPMPGEGPPM
jgi:CHAD domain-containing protein